jgi:hypothetical protein
MTQRIVDWDIRRRIVYGPAAPFIPAGLAIAGSIMGAIGSSAAGSAGSTATLQAAQANLGFLNAQAGAEAELGGIAYNRDLREGLILRGHSLAALAGSGVDPTSGSPLDLLSQQAKESEYRAEVDRFQHNEKAWELSMQGSLGIQEANATAGAYQARGTSGAIGDILGGATKAAGAINFGKAGDAISGAVSGLTGDGVTATAVGPFLSTL